MATVDSQFILEKVSDVFEEYIKNRFDELLSTERGASRISTEKIQGILGKAQAAHDLKALVGNVIR